MNSNTTVDLRTCLLVAPCFAIATLVVAFHRYTLRGDHIVLGHATGFTALYFVLRASSLSDVALKTSAKIYAAYILNLILVTLAYRLSPWHPLASYPGPLLAKTTSLWLTYISSTGKRYLILDALHARYGPFLRIDVSGLRYLPQADLVPQLERRAEGDMVFGGCNRFEMMKNGDQRNIIGVGKRAMAMLDILGQSPWLLDILWRLPLTARMRAHEKNATEMMRARVKAVDLPDYRDLASYLIDAEVRPKDLEADAIVAIIGGSDNTSITVTFAIYFLLSSPEYYHSLRKELDEAFPDPACPLPLNTLADLVFLDAVINETLRLASPYFNPRIIPRGGSMVDGKYIPGGTIVALAAHSQQVSPDNFYPSPQEFLPDRWLPDGLGPETQTNKAMLASFSYGAHSCIGKVLAYHQMRLALARLLLAFDFKLQEGFDVAGFRAGILNMRTMFLEKQLYVKVAPRPGVDLNALENALV